MSDTTTILTNTVRGEAPLLRQSLERLPERLFSASLDLQILRIWSLSVNVPIEQVEPLIEALPETPAVQPHKWTLLANLRRKQLRLEPAIEYARAVIELDFTLQRDFLLGTAWINLGMCYAIQHQTDQAMLAFEQTMALNRKIGNTITFLVAGHQKSRIAMFQGHLSEARRMYETLIQDARRWGLGQRSLVGVMLLHLAVNAYFRSETDKVWDYTGQGLELILNCYNTHEGEGYRTALELCCRLENWELMDRILVQLEDLMAQRKLKHISFQISTFQAWRAVRRREWEWLDSWSQLPIERPNDYKEWLIRAEYFLDRGKAAKALEYLEVMWQIASRGKYVTPMLETLCLQAIALKSEPAQAQQKLKSALSLMAGEAIHYIWHERAEDLLELIAAGRFSEAETRLLNQIYPQRLNGYLNEREQALLEMMAAGLSNPQMAEQLFVSVNTIKSHLKNLFRKLGVESRTEAVAKALALNWIHKASE